MSEANEIVDAAVRQYFTDAEFHARVHLTIRAVEEAKRIETGGAMDDDELHIVALAASVALHTSNIPLEQGGVRK